MKAKEVRKEGEPTEYPNVQQFLKTIRLPMMVEGVFIEKYVEPFLEFLDDMCMGYKVIGMGTHESPMWLQYLGVHNEDGRPKFKSSQCSLGFFLNYIDEEDKTYFRQGTYDKKYNYFKWLKYSFIKTMHPTIYKELR